MRKDNVLQIIMKMKDEASAKIKSANTQVKSFSNTLSKGDIAMGAFGVSMVALARNTLEISASFEQTTMAFEVMTGSAEQGQATLNQLFNFARTTPFTIPEIENNSKSLLAMGVSTRDLIPTMRALGNASSALSVPLERIAINYGQVLAQGKLTGFELRDFVRAGVPLITELANVTGRAKEEIKDMVSNGEIGFRQVEIAFQNMSAEGGIYNDMLQRQSETFNGYVSNIKDGMIGIQREYGAYLRDALKDLIDKMGGPDGVIESVRGAIDILSVFRGELKLLTTVLVGGAGLSLALKTVNGIMIAIPATVALAETAYIVYLLAITAVRKALVLASAEMVIFNAGKTAVAIATGVMSAGFAGLATSIGLVTLAAGAALLAIGAIVYVTKGYIDLKKEQAETEKIWRVASEASNQTTEKTNALLQSENEEVKRLGELTVIAQKARAKADNAAFKGTEKEYNALKEKSTLARNAMQEQERAIKSTSSAESEAYEQSIKFAGMTVDEKNKVIKVEKDLMEAQRILSAKEKEQQEENEKSAKKLNAELEKLPAKLAKATEKAEKFAEKSIKAFKDIKKEVKDLNDEIAGIGSQMAKNERDTADSLAGAYVDQQEKVQELQAEALEAEKAYMEELSDIKQSKKAENLKIEEDTIKEQLGLLKDSLDAEKEINRNKTIAKTLEADEVIAINELIAAKELELEKAKKAISNETSSSKNNDKLNELLVAKQAANNELAREKLALQEGKSIALVHADEIAQIKKDRNKTEFEQARDNIERIRNERVYDLQIQRKEAGEKLAIALILHDKNKELMVEATLKYKEAQDAQGKIAIDTANTKIKAINAETQAKKDAARMKTASMVSFQASTMPVNTGTQFGPSETGRFGRNPFTVNVYGDVSGEELVNKVSEQLMGKLTLNGI